MAITYTAFFTIVAAFIVIGQIHATNAIPISSTVQTETLVDPKQPNPVVEETMATQDFDRFDAQRLFNFLFSKYRREAVPAPVYPQIYYDDDLVS
jgi:hypothetical protein